MISNDEERCYTVSSLATRHRMWQTQILVCEMAHCFGLGKSLLLLIFEVSRLLHWEIMIKIIPPFQESTLLDSAFFPSLLVLLELKHSNPFFDTQCLWIPEGQRLCFTVRCDKVSVLVRWYCRNNVSVDSFWILCWLGRYWSRFSRRCSYICLSHSCIDFVNLFGTISAIGRFLWMHPLIWSFQHIDALIWGFWAHHLLKLVPSFGCTVFRQPLPLWHLLFTVRSRIPDILESQDNCMVIMHTSRGGEKNEAGAGVFVPSFWKACKDQLNFDRSFECSGWRCRHSWLDTDHDNQSRRSFWLRFDLARLYRQKSSMGYMAGRDVVSMLGHYFKCKLRCAQVVRVESLISGKASSNLPKLNVMPAQVEQKTTEYEDLKEFIQALETMALLQYCWNENWQTLLQDWLSQIGLVICFCCCELKACYFLHAFYSLLNWGSAVTLPYRAHEVLCWSKPKYAT